MPAQYMKAYVKRNKNDAADAEAICEAVQRPTMRFVPIKTAEQQAAQLLHRGREQLVRQRTMLVNALRAASAGGLCASTMDRTEPTLCCRTVEPARFTCRQRLISSSLSAAARSNCSPRAATAALRQRCSLTASPSI